MKLSVCTISFRHQLISLEQIALWAKCHHFDAIELWGVHAKNMSDFPQYDRDWLESLGLSVSMLSDYLPLDTQASSAAENAGLFCRLARQWGAKKLRTFSGSKASADISDEQRALWTKRLREHCVIADDYGLQLVVETHPNTLADTLASTKRLIEEVNHPALRINFDVIHVWEMGSEPVNAFSQLEPKVVHVHLKNVASRKQLPVFAPANVYAPAGTREGMSTLFEGQFDYRRFLCDVFRKSTLDWSELDASLEWFGPNSIRTLEHDANKLRALALNSDFAANKLNNSLAPVI
ncbi:sugar phosphate isomerase/epimerase family protein [Agaribacterium haliotis]|uniref:sugar phosphate isomerase/epimerase family protein n=1 Tax=Agaribacterium haliotis TaxID=2013869 RepID=UPI000BB58537|nr:sugar phosphate isomerase/epimerase [Agaribacterium haliotis]